MPAQNFEPADLSKFIASMLDSAAAAQHAGAPHASLLDSWRRPEPQLLPIPAVTRGFRIRIDLQRTKPPVWRRIEVPGSLTLPQLHEVIQAAMGWSDSHLHRFRTSNERNSPEFLTQFDLAEGDEGLLEDDVRLDQVIASVGDRLWYDYDFGDNWQHVLRVEQVLDSPPQAAVCIGGKLACPPEDCGGTWGYSEIADWVRADYDASRRPEVFGSTAEALEWLPMDWHPDVFSAEEANEQLAAVTAEPVAVVEELASLLVLSEQSGTRALRERLASPAAHGSAEVSDEDALRLTAPFHVLLDVIGDGADLTAAGYLKPALVEQIAERTGITDWWIGKANREDLTWPVANLRAAARSLGLVSVRKGRIAQTKVAAGCTGDPQKMLRHIAGRLPLGTDPAERQAGWIALTLAGSETPAEHWTSNISSMLFEFGWRDGANPYSEPHADSTTLDVLRILRGTSRKRRLLEGFDHAVSAFARSVIQA